MALDVRQQRTVVGRSEFGDQNELFSFAAVTSNVIGASREVRARITLSKRSKLGGA